MTPISKAFILVVCAAIVAIACADSTSKTIHRDDYGDAWPFTVDVDEVGLHCDDRGITETAATAVWISIDHAGTTERYPINGMAQGPSVRKAHGITNDYDDLVLAPFRRYVPNAHIFRQAGVTPPKVDMTSFISDIRSDGLEMCGHYQNK